MASMVNTKLKMLHILDILEKHSDENNILTMNDINCYLGMRGIDAERRSIIRDIRVLIDFGYDISMYEENKKGYFVRGRQFEKEELKILIDSVVAFKALTPEMTRNLIKKLMSLTSRNIARELEKNLYINIKGKSQNRKIYHVVNMLNLAIKKDKKVCFKYLTYDIEKGKKFRKGGKDYVVSPYALAWCEDNYYLIGVHNKYTNISHYRVDRINDVKILEENRKVADCIESISQFNAAEYLDKTFNVFTGEKKRVKLRFHNELIDTIIDKFGMDSYLRTDGDEHSIVAADIIVSEGFISWILQFGDKIEVLEPKSVIEKLKDEIIRLNELYDVSTDCQCC